MGQDFNKADKGRKFSKGGDTMASKMNAGFMAMMAKKKSMKMADGGMPMVMKDGKKVPAFAADGKGAMKKGGMAKGGGIESRGKTKGKMITMKSGGRAC